MSRYLFKKSVNSMREFADFFIAAASRPSGRMNFDPPIMIVS